VAQSDDIQAVRNNFQEFRISMQFPLFKDADDSSWFRNANSWL